MDPRFFSVVEESFMACLTDPMRFVADESNADNVAFFVVCLTPSSLSFVVRLVLRDSEVIDADRL